MKLPNLWNVAASLIFLLDTVSPSPSSAPPAAFCSTIRRSRRLAADEAKKEAAAKVKMQFATEYKIEDYVKYPVMQAKFKENVESASKGEIFVKLFPAGALGIGAALAQKIQSGTVSGGAVSLSNFSPFTPVVDMINIPYWCGENQNFANLVTSAAWNDEITPKVMEKGYKPMFYYTVDPRTIATRKGFKAIKTPADMAGMKMRVPPSAMLQQIYKLAGANPTVVAWGETAAAIKQGVADGARSRHHRARDVRLPRHPRQRHVREDRARRADVRRQCRLVQSAVRRPAQGLRRCVRQDADRDLRADRERARRSR